VSVPGGPDSAESGQYRVPGGLLEKLMAAVRPEFRSGELVFDPADPVFGGAICRADSCPRTARGGQVCAMATMTGGPLRAGRTWTRSPQRPV
jgi:hypothetical protein